VCRTSLKELVVKIRTSLKELVVKIRTSLKELVLDWSESNTACSRR
jgi:hypothetical protein